MPPIPHVVQEVSRFARANDLFHRGDSVLAAVSGGVDSVVMLDVLAFIADEWGLVLRIVHINHLLRGRESDADENFVRALAERYGIPISVERVETKKFAATKKLSTQEAARELRYEFFFRMLTSCKAQSVATAHTANDNAETMLMNLLRGTGIDGVAGIPIRRNENSIVRPLLSVSRQEIAAYAKQKKLAFREDSSNASDKYSRNYLRRNIIPLLEKRINPSLIRTMSQSSAVFRNCAEYLDGQVRRAFSAAAAEKNDGVFLGVDALMNEHPYIRQMVIHSLFLGKGIELSFDRIAALLALIDAEKGSRADCGNGWVAEKESGQIFIFQSGTLAPFSYLLNSEGTLKGGSFSLSVEKCGRIPNKLTAHTSTEEYVDARKVRFPLRVRSWKEGDAFVPLGMRSRKKVSDLFVDMKISRVRKEAIPIVESNGDILWVAGCRLDDRCKITPTTTEAYKFSIHSA